MQQNHPQRHCLTKRERNLFSKYAEVFLFLGRSVESTPLFPISAITPQSANPTKETMRQTQQLLDYIATQEDAIITYSNSDMTLAVHIDESYLIKAKARIQAGYHLFLSNKEIIPQKNSVVINIAHIIKHVITSATKAELAALYIMERKSVYIRIILVEMGYYQPPTQFQTDNAMADAV